MKKILVVAAVIATVVVMAGGAFAAPTVDVQATVQSKCGSPVNGAFSVLSIDPALGADQPFTVSTPATIKCTKNRTTISITAASLYGTTNATPATCDGTLLTGFTMQGASAAEKINYSFKCDASIVGQGFGAVSDVSLGIGASVLNADAASADYNGGGTYNDTVTLTVNY